MFRLSLVASPTYYSRDTTPVRPMSTHSTQLSTAPKKHRYPPHHPLCFPKRYTYIIRSVPWFQTLNHTMSLAPRSLGVLAHEPSDVTLSSPHQRYTRLHKHSLREAQAPMHSLLAPDTLCDTKSLESLNLVQLITQSHSRQGTPCASRPYVPDDFTLAALPCRPT